MINVGLARFPAPGSLAAGCVTALLITPVLAQAPPLDGSFTLTLTLAAPPPVSLDANHGAWICSARVLGKAAADAEIAKIAGLSGAAARDEFAAFLEYRAHYLGQQSRSEFAISSGQAGPAAPAALVVKRDDLVDPVSHRALAQPAVLAGCWLYLATAAGQGGYALQAGKAAAGIKAAPGPLLQVSGRPYLLASSEVPNA